ncbi:MAG: type II toxin-antitoxin system HicA family toxin [Desulfobacteraceae bacterium]
MSYIQTMNGNELIKKLKRIAKDRGIEFRIDHKRGKGSHGTLYLGDRMTVIKDPKKDIRPGLLKSMLNDLGLNREDLE